MSINNNAVFPESIDAILAEKYIFNCIDEELKLLIVEGVDDIQVISKYFFFNKNCDSPFRVCVGEDLEENSSGKLSAITSFYKYVDSYPNLVCLLDRDLDFLLGKNESNQRIVYYDFYELENYLFEESILKSFINRYYKFENISDYREILGKFSNLAQYYLPLCYMLVARELFSMDISDEDKFKLNKIAELAKKDLSKVIRDESPKYLGCDLIEKINLYIDEELKKVNLNKEFIKELCVNNELASEIHCNHEDKFYIFKYGIGSKTVLKSIQILMEQVIDLNFNRAGTKSSLEEELKKEWIPKSSELFAELMTKIEAEI